MHKIFFREFPVIILGVKDTQSYSTSPNEFSVRFDNFK